MTPTRRQATERLGHYLHRTKQIATDREIRNYYLALMHLRRLRKINPRLQVLGVDDEGGPTFVDVNDEIITPVLVARGHFQRTDLHHAVELAQRLIPRPGAGTFLDVGANVGTTTLYAQRTGHFRRCVSVEPSPGNLHVLRLNIQANHLEDVVHVVPAACGATESEVELLLSSISSGDHRVRRGDEVPSTHQQIVKVPQRPLDAILADEGVDPDDVSLVWVDTQGHEPSVLAGAGALLRSGPPWVVEFWPEQYAENGVLADYVAVLQEQFRAYVDLREGGNDPEHDPKDLAVLADRLLGEHHGQTDLLLLPR